MNAVNGLKKHLDMERSTAPATFLSQEMINELHPKALAGDDEAMGRIIDSLIPWTISVATRIFQHRPEQRIPVELDDLIQQALLGLIGGIQRFDPERGYKLTTYCWFYVRRSCLNYYYDGGLVRVPKYINASPEFRQRRIGPAFGPVFGLGPGNQIYAKKEDSVDFLEHQVLFEKLDLLPERESQILIERYYEGETLAVIGKKRNLSRERIRQIINKSLKVLRESMNGSSNPT